MTIKRIQKNTCRGFTLVEALIAIAILLIAVVAPISIIGKAIHGVYYAKDEMLALNLAQEGVEIVRKIRDSNMLLNDSGVVTAWDNGLAAGTYIVNAPTFAITLCVACDTKIYKNASGFYTQGTVATATQFTSRTVVITDVVAGREKKIVSTVTWRTGGDTQSIVVAENIFKLRP